MYKNKILVFLRSILIFANCSISFGNVNVSETQNFNPAVDGLGFVTVHSSSILQPFSFNIGYFGNYAVNTLPIFKDSEEGQNAPNFKDRTTSSQFHLALALHERFQIGVAIPYLNEQKLLTSGENQGRFIQNGNIGTSFQAKVNLYKGENAGVATVMSVYKDRVKDNPFVGINSGPTYTLELVVDRKLRNHLVAVNFGHRWRNSGDPILEENNPIRPLLNQFIFSTAANIGITDNQSIIGEIFAGIPTQKAPAVSDRLESSAELLLGYKVEFFNDQMAFHIGAGRELIHGHASPDWRAYAGINWSPRHNEKPKATLEPETAQVIIKPTVAEGPLGPISANETIVMNEVLFKFDSSILQLNGLNRKIQKLPKHLNTEPKFTKLIIVGHTDALGSKEYNRGLSLRRAQSIKQWLVFNYKLDPKKIITIGKGEDYPIASNKVEAGRKRNRRVEFKIYRGDNSTPEESGKKDKPVRNIRYK